MELKIDGKLSPTAAAALEDHAKTLYLTPGARRVGIIELRRDYNTVPDPSGAKKAVVGLAIAGLEIANSPAQENSVREAQRALYLQRTARGTLQEDGQIELYPETIDLLGELLNDLELARLRAALHRWTTELGNLKGQKLTETELRHELDRIHDGMEAALHPAREGGGDDS
jgi:hypothetical protein